MPKKWIMLVMTLIVLLITMPLLAACDDDDDEDETKTVQPTKTAKPTETLMPTEKVGATEPADGCTEEVEFRVGGTGTVMGMTAEAQDISGEMAMDIMNDMGGIQIGDTCVKFKYTYLDDTGTSAGAISAIQKLLYEFDAKAVWNTGSPTVAATLTRPYTEEEEAIYFSNHSVEEWIGEEYPYTFQLQYNTALDPFILLDWISKNRPDIKTVHGVRAISTATEIMVPALEKAALPEYGIEYTGTDWHELQTRDFYPVLTDALKGEPDAIFIDTYSMTMAAKQARELGYEGTFIAVGAIPEFAFKMMTPEEINDIISLTPSMESPLVPQYYKDYKETYNERKGTYPYSITTFPSYLTMFYIAAAIKTAGSTDTTKIKEVMETQTLTLEFPSGDTMDIKMGGAEHYGANHAFSPPRYIAVVENGKPVVKEATTTEQFDHYLATYMKYQ